MLGEFTAEVDALLVQPGVRASLPAPQVRREVCVAVWAAITAALEASAMSHDEHERLEPLLRDTLLPFWQTHCATNPDVAREMAAQAPAYLSGRDPRSQVATATHIVRRLLDTIGSEGEERRLLTRKLIPLFAHHMLGDTHHINHLKTRFGFQLPLIATLCLTATVADAVEPALRLLRLA